MQNIMSRSRLCIPGALLCAAVGALAQPTASMDLYSPGGNVMGNVYVGPYYAYINGVQTAVICDDYGDESFVPETWTAQEFTTPNYVISSTDETRNAQQWPSLSPAQLAQDYNMVGWLAIQMMDNSGNATTVGEIDYALWDVFNSSAITDLTSVNSAYATAASGWLSLAQNYANNSSFISEFTIYSPDQSDPISCGGQTCTSIPPQEFLVYTPEPSQIVLLGCDFLGAAMLVFLLRRRRA